MSFIPGGDTASYDGLKEKYKDFRFPEAVIELGGKQFSDKEKHTVVNDVMIELTSGYEASAASFRIYNVFDHETGRFRFEDVKNQVVLGNSLEIKLGYLGAVETVFVGFVASVSFGYDPASSVYIEVTGMDVKGIMMSGSYAMQLAARSYSEAVREVLEKTAYGNLQSGDAIRSMQITDTPDKKQGGGSGESADTIEMVSESDYEFVVKAARKFGYEFFTECGKVYFRKPKSDTNPLMGLGVSAGLAQFDISYSLTGMVETIEARAMDAGTGKIVTSKSKYTGTLSTGSKAKKLIKGSRHVYIDPSIVTQEHADARVASLLETMQYRLGSLRCDCVGIPELLPGHFIKIEGLGVPADNKFYLTNVVHSLTMESGYVTKLTGCANEIKT